LDRRHLEVCPIIDNEPSLRLLNLQNNSIKLIQNIENLPNLIFLDLYSNQLTTLNGTLSACKNLRVLMAGKNKISAISNLAQFKRLDVLDLHSNDIRTIEGLDSLSELRVLNLAGNKISSVQNLGLLITLTELNLRRNSIERVFDLDHLPSLQRVFLSHNRIAKVTDMTCLFHMKSLVELSLDSNPVCMDNPSKFRRFIISTITTLKCFDLKPVSDEDAVENISNIEAEFTLVDDKMVAVPNEQLPVESTEKAATAVPVIADNPLEKSLLSEVRLGRIPLNAKHLSVEVRRI
jgi:Leucine-rich repeat (LRR) protein